VPKFIKILAASVGGGLLFGAGIRLGEAIVTSQSPTDDEPASKLTDRLKMLERRMRELEGSTSTEKVAPFPDLTTSAVSDFSGATELQHELHNWMEKNVAARMSEIESRLRAESERGQQEMLDSFVENVQTRVIQRITRLEDEVASQSAAMNELRECSLRTERSVQKLLGGLDRLIVSQTPQRAPSEENSQTAVGTGNQGDAVVPHPSPAEGSTDSPAPATTDPPNLSRPRSGWRIFR